MPKEGQLVTETSALPIGKVAGEIPPLGFEFDVRMMIAGKFITPARLRRFPIASRRRDGEQESEKKRRAFHSSRRLSASSIRLARQAGMIPAMIAAARIQTGVQTRLRQGKARW